MFSMALQIPLSIQLPSAVCDWDLRLVLTTFDFGRALGSILASLASSSDRRRLDASTAFSSGDDAIVRSNSMFGITQ
jgi:hypothetical protein